jgi:hypothetical protein
MIISEPARARARFRKFKKKNHWEGLGPIFGSLRKRKDLLIVSATNSLFDEVFHGFGQNLTVIQAAKRGWIP